MSILNIFFIVINFVLENITYLRQQTAKRIFIKVAFLFLYFLSNSENAYYKNKNLPKYGGKVKKPLGFDLKQLSLSKNQNKNWKKNFL